MAQALAKMLGEYVGRGRRLKDPEKAKAIVNFAPPTSLKQLQEFLGMFNYVRPGCRGSAGRHLHFLRPWLRGEKFPMSPSALSAVDALKTLAAEQVEISCIDEKAAIGAFHPDETVRLADGPIRPGESLADSSGYAIGGGLVQMRADLGSYALLASYSAGLTITQMQQHPMEQELWSQLQCSRAWRQMVGRFPYLHWTDHAQLVRLCMLALERIDPKHFRWFQEIVSNGSELGSLAGRSMRLGDSLSRNPEHRDALQAALECRNGDLNQMKSVIRGSISRSIRAPSLGTKGFIRRRTG